MITAVKTKPKVSVIIPTYNNAKYLTYAVESAIEQTYTDYEIIVIDDGSTDNTRNVLDPYRDRINYIYQEHQGVSTARNLGIEKAKGELIAFLDADDYFLPEHLAEQTACLENQPLLGMVSSGWYRVDRDGEVLSENKPWQVLPKLNLETWLLSRPVLPTAIMVRKEWLEAVDGFKPEFELAQDIDLILRLSLRGCQAQWSKKITSCYRASTSNATNDTIKQAKFFDAVYNDFFSQPNLPEDVVNLEERARYDYLKWLGWRLYHTGHMPLMTNYLCKSLMYTPHSTSETISDWIQYFSSCSWEAGCDLDAYSLSNLPEWKQLIRYFVITQTPKNHQATDENWNFYLKQGDFLKEQGEIDDAVRCYQNAFKIQPNLTEVKNKLSTLLKEKIAKEVSLDTSIEAYRKLGEAWGKQGKIAETIALYSLAVERIPDSQKLYKSLGDALKKQGQLDDAIVAYQKSLDLDPKFPWSYKALGEAWQLKGQRSKAIANYQKAIELKSKIFADVYSRLASLLEIEEKWDQVINYHQSALKLYSQKPNSQLKIYEKLGDAFIHQQNWEQVCVNLVKVLEIKPDHFPAYEKIADILEKQGKPIVPVANATTPSTYCELPQEFIEQYGNLPKDWLINCQSEPTIEYIPVYPSGHTIFLSSTTLEEVEVPSCMQTQVVNLHEAFIAVVPEGRAWADRVMSAVITNDNKILADTHSGPVGLLLSSEKLPSPQYIDGKVAFLSVRWGQRGYFHWIYDILSRIELLRLGGIDLDSIDKFVINKCAQKFQIATLNHLGIPREKIIESLEIPHIQAKSLIVPSLPQLRAYRDPKWSCKALQRRFLNPEDLKIFNKVERIYINRLDAPHRRVVNEERVIKFLESWGFTNVALESMSFSEQVLCMASAKVVVAVHGAGLSNLVFCNPGTKVIEIFSPAHVQNTYWRISNACGLEHYHLMSDDSDPNVNLSERSVKRDVCVNLDDLTVLLKNAGLAPPAYTTKSYQQQMRLIPARFVLYRIIGNDLPPRHKQGQTLENVKFILDREPCLKNCQKRWILNRIVDREQEEIIIQMLKNRGQKFTRIPFLKEEYIKTKFNYEGLPGGLNYLKSQEFQKLNHSQQSRIMDHVYHYKNLYVMNNNGARNIALREGRNLAKWVLPWDGNCFLTEKAWQELREGIDRFPDTKYFIIPMARILGNEQLLDPNFRPDPNEEPQIIFRQDAMEEFNERTVRYGRFSKIEMLWRLGVPGKWDRWGYHPWEKVGIKTCYEHGQFETIGWVARLFSGNRELETDSTKRNHGRMQSIRQLLDSLDKQVRDKY